MGVLQEKTAFQNVGSLNFWGRVRPNSLFLLLYILLQTYKAFIPWARVDVNADNGFSIPQ